MCHILCGALKHTFIFNDSSILNTSGEFSRLMVEEAQNLIYRVTKPNDLQSISFFFFFYSKKVILVLEYNRGIYMS